MESSARFFFRGSNGYAQSTSKYHLMRVGVLGILFLGWVQISPSISGTYQGIVGCTPIPTYPSGRSLYKAYIYIYSGYLRVSYPQESLENTINTMGTLLGVHPIVP